MSNLTPYAAAKQVNEWLASEGRDKVLPAQMFYNYTKGRINKGKAPLIEVDSDNKIAITTLSEWYAKYTAKQDRLAAAKVEKVEVDDVDPNQTSLEDLVEAE